MRFSFKPEDLAKPEYPVIPSNVYRATVEKVKVAPVMDKETKEPTGETSYTFFFKLSDKVQVYNDKGEPYLIQPQFAVYTNPDRETMRWKFVEVISAFQFTEEDLIADDFYDRFWAVKPNQTELPVFKGIEVMLEIEIKPRDGKDANNVKKVMPPKDGGKSVYDVNDPTDGLNIS